LIQQEEIVNRTASLASIGVLFFILVFSFQNCSVYQSSGRKYLDSTGVDVSAASQTKPIAAIDKESCEQYLTANFVDDWSGGSTVVRSFAKLDNMGLSCMYSISESQNQIDHIACDISSEIRTAAEFPEEGEEEVLNSNLGSITSQVAEEGLCLNIAPRVGSLGAKCCFSSALAYESLEKESIKVGIEIIKHIR
jgi:hypothetical protein